MEIGNTLSDGRRYDPFLLKIIPSSLRINSKSNYQNNLKRNYKYERAVKKIIYRLR
jgi:hypothetical protein